MGQGKASPDEELLSRIGSVSMSNGAKVAQWGPDVMRYVRRPSAADPRSSLARHLVMLDHLRQVIGLRGYGQRDPLQE